MHTLREALERSGIRKQVAYSETKKLVGKLAYLLDEGQVRLLEYLLSRSIERSVVAKRSAILESLNRGKFREFADIVASATTKKIKVLCSSILYYYRVSTPRQNASTSASERKLIDWYEQLT